MATTEKTLADAFYETLKDVYFAEKQSLKACKKSAKAASDSNVKKAFEQHAEETAHHVERLGQVFEILGKPARSKTCEAMQGISSEMESDLEDFGGTAVADAVIIGGGLAVEHYEIARYTLLKTWATALGMPDAAKLLDETLQEELKAGDLLAKLAESNAGSTAKAKAA